MSHAKSLFYKDYVVRTLELKGDYEIWVRDIEEYFAVSGLPEHFAAIVDYTKPDIRADFDEELYVPPKRTKPKTRGNAESSSSSSAEPEQQMAETKEIDLRLRHTVIMKQARYAVYRSLGDTIKREIAKEGFNTATVMDLWVAVRNCFYLRDESTVQQLRDAIMSWDMEKASNWDSYTEGLERYYSRLDIVAGSERSFTYSDKLYKLRNTLSKLEGDKEKQIFNQIEVMVDASEKEPKSLYEQCFKFADKRMKLLDRPVVPRQTAFQVSTPTTTCTHCKQAGHKWKECPEKKKQRDERAKTLCRSWNASERLFYFEKRTGRKCGYKHPSESVGSIEAQEPPFQREIAWMFHEPRTVPSKKAIKSEVYKTITGRAGDRCFDDKWVMDGGATTNLSNGIGFIPGTKKSKTTIIEVVGQTKITCSEVADYELPIFLSKTEKGTPLVLKEVPILPNLKYNLISESSSPRKGSRC